MLLQLPFQIGGPTFSARADGNEVPATMPQTPPSGKAVMVADMNAFLTRHVCLRGVLNCSEQTRSISFVHQAPTGFPTSNWTSLSGTILTFWVMAMPDLGSAPLQAHVSNVLGTNSAPLTLALVVRLDPCGRAPEPHSCWLPPRNSAPLRLQSAIQCAKIICSFSQFVCSR